MERGVADLVRGVEVKLVGVLKESLNDPMKKKICIGLLIGYLQIKYTFQVEEVEWLKEVKLFFVLLYVSQWCSPVQWRRQQFVLEVDVGVVLEQHADDVLTVPEYKMNLFYEWLLVRVSKEKSIAPWQERPT